jgi:sulfite reductase (NADPH) flavoprotein alpha-component
MKKENYPALSNRNNIKNILSNPVKPKGTLKPVISQNITMEKTNNLIPPMLFNDIQKQQIESLLHGLDEKQMIWLAGYLTGVGLSKTGNQPAILNHNNHPQVKVNGQAVAELTVIYGSRTGNGATVAKKIKAEAEAQGFFIKLEDMNEYPLHKLKDEKNLLVIVSTHGEGVPPIAAEEFYEFIHGKRAPKLNNTKFSVLALGDSSYVHFCKTGKDLDQRLEALGAERLYPRTDCDVDFAENATAWISGVLSKFANKTVKEPEIKLNGHAHIETDVPVYNKQNPFKSRLLEKTGLNGRGSDKDTYHLELSIEDSGITYEPGDSLGVFSVNPEKLVNELLALLTLNADDEVATGVTLKEALTRNYEISLLTSDVVSKYNKFAQSTALNGLLQNTEQLKDFLYGRDLIDLITKYPVKITAVELLSCLKKLQPRLYSISSSSKAHPGEVHLTVSALRYSNGRKKQGICSTYLTDIIGYDDTILIYIEKNPEFHLPENSDAPVIMIGPGTGIAPFRAFLEERETAGNKGKNWLFFGDRHFTTDFLYQTELQAFHKKGLLTNLNVAFSRDRDQKVYVQHKMHEHSKELFLWLEEGAHFYVCGDMKHMWHDVNKTLLEIIGKEGNLTTENAEEYLRNLKRTKRYKVDVY